MEEIGVVFRKSKFGLDEDEEHLNPDDYAGLETVSVCLDCKSNVKFPITYTFLSLKFYIVILIVTMSLVYIIALVLLIKRKDFQPLKSRSVSLIFVSTLGNFLYFSTLMYNKILQNNRWNIWNDIGYKEKFDKSTQLAIELSCFFSNSQWWLFRTVWFVPYLFRCYRLHLIWGMQKIYYVDNTAT